MKIILRSWNTFIKSFLGEQLCEFRDEVESFMDNLCQVWFEVFIALMLKLRASGMWCLVHWWFLPMFGGELAAHIFRIVEEELMTGRVYCPVYRKRRLGTSHSEPVGGEVWKGWHSLIRKCPVQPLPIKILSTRPQCMVQVFREMTGIDFHPNNVNGEDGLIFSRLWNPLIHSLKEQRNRGNLLMKTHDNNIAAICRASKSRLSFALPSSVSLPSSDSSTYH